MVIAISSVLRIVCAFALVLCFAPVSFAQGTAGKVSGTVIDKSTREPLPAASVRVKGTPMGAIADEKGQYFILNLAPGTYDLVVNVIGYAPIRVEGVRIMQDFTTYQDFELESTVLEVIETVTVMAERPLVEKSLTYSRTVISPEEIKALPVINIVEVILTTAGSIAGHLRGGRSQDQQTTLDGATVTSQRGNVGQAFIVNPFMIQELEVKTGTYNAEYVNALSGITSVVTRDGGSKFNGNLEYRTLAQPGFNWTKPPPLDLVDRLRTGESDEDDLKGLIRSVINATNTYNNDPARLDDGLELKFPFDVLDTSSSDLTQWTARYNRDNYYWDYDRIIPEPEGAGFSYLTLGLSKARQNSFNVDRSYHPDKYNKFARNNRTEKRTTQFDWGIGGPIGEKINGFFSGRFNETWGRQPNEYNRLMNFFGKITIRPSASTKLSLSGLIEDNGFFSGKGSRIAIYEWKYILEGLNQRFNGRLHFNLNFTHTLNERTFYEFRYSHLREYTETYNPKFDKSPLPNPSLSAVVTSIGYNPVEQSRLNQTGYLVHGDEAYANYVGGNFTNIRPFRTDLSWSITSQMNTNHQLKAGTGVTLYDYHEQRRGQAQGTAPQLFNSLNNVAAANAIKLSGWEYHVYPTEYFLYAQDRIEYDGLIVNVGFRLDIFDPKSNYINPFRPRSGSGSSNDDPKFLTLHPSIKTGLAPRLGISHPITDRAAVHYSYGIFNQRPGLNFLYDGLVQSFPSEHNHGNPDLPFMTAVNYEMGVQAEIYPGYYLDVTGYIRDVNNLAMLWDVIPETEFTGGPSRDISIYMATFAQDARGFEVSFRRMMANRFSIRANYTVAFVQDLTVPPIPIIETFADFVNETPRPSSYVRRASVFDRRHRIVTNLLFELPFKVNASFLTKAMSGNEYRSKNENSTDPLGLLGKARRSPWTTTTDMYAQKVFNLGGILLGVFAQINNLFDRTNIYGIGSSPAAERWLQRGDPAPFTGGPPFRLGAEGNGPRDIWVGLNLSW